MSPDDFYRWYKHLSPAAYLPDGRLKLLGDVGVRRYVTRSTIECQDLPQIELALQELLAAVQTYIRQARQPECTFGNREFAAEFVLQEEAFSRAKVGRGSPADLEHVLAAGLICGRLAADPDGARITAREFAGLYLGVDAVGFVAAYYQQLRLLPAADRPQYLDCDYFRIKAQAGAAGGFIWNGSAIRQGDVLLWMLENGNETRPGDRCALVQSVLDVSVNVVAGRFTEMVTGWHLFCRESGGGTGDDPRTSEYTLVEPVKGERRAHYWETIKAEKVIVVRPFV